MKKSANISTTELLPKSRSLLLPSVIILFIILAPVPAAATVNVAADQYDIGIGEIVSDDLFVAGGKITINGDALGDLILAGGDIQVAGNVTGDAWIAGGSLRIGGNIGDDLRAAGGEIRLDGAVSDNAMIAGGTVITGNGSSVGKDLDVAGGAVDIAGRVGGNLSASAGSIIIRAPIDGNVVIESNDIQILPGARIGGNLEYTGDRQIDIPDGVVTGKIIYKKPQVNTGARDFTQGIISVLLPFLSILLIGLILINLAGNTTLDIADRISAHFLKSAGIGLALLVLIPLLAIVLMITRIGLPLGIILLVLYALALYISMIFAGLSTGKLILKHTRPWVTSPGWYLAIGLLAIAVAINIPVIGALVKLLVIVTGLGALGMKLDTAYRESRGI